MPMTQKEIWKLERGFWLGDARYYAEHMADHAMMVFPEPVGVLQGDEIVAGLAGAPRWSDVTFYVRTGTRAGDTLVLAYRAEATREGAPPYVALCSSTYNHTGEAWELLAHQQTPVVG